MSFRSPYEDLYEFNEDFRNKVNLIRKKCRKESILRQIEKLKQELKELEEEDDRERKESYKFIKNLSK